MQSSKRRNAVTRRQGRRPLHGGAFGAAVAAALGALALALPAHSQGTGDVRQLTGRALNDAWVNRASTGDEALTNLIRGHLAERNIGTPTTAVRFIPLKPVPIDGECSTILKGKNYRLGADELPSRVTLRWNELPENGVSVGTTLRYEVNDRQRADNALKFFSYPTLVAEPLPDGSYHAQVLVPTGSVFAQLAAVGKLFETGQKIRLGSHNSDYVAPAGSITAVILDNDVQRVVRDYFLPLESFVSHPRHSPRSKKSRYRMGYLKDLDVVYVVPNRVYDVFLIRGNRIQLARSEPWTFIQNAKTYNSPAYERRLADLCVTVFPDTKPAAKVATRRAVKPPAPAPAQPPAALPLKSAEDNGDLTSVAYWRERGHERIEWSQDHLISSLLNTDYSNVGN